jgi:plastocyanin
VGIKGIGACALALLVGCCSSAAAATYDVGANGNVFTGGLAFAPTELEIGVGDTVRWTNNDFLVPHTATQKSGLFRLTGEYGQTPLNPPGFGPGDTRERAFEAGTFHYYCEVHPEQMRAVIAVPPTVERVGRDARRVRVTWASTPAPEGEVFDVKRRVHGKFRLVRKRATGSSATFEGGGQFKVRARSANDPNAFSDFSPPGQAHE